MPTNEPRRQNRHPADVGSEGCVLNKSLRMGAPRDLVPTSESHRQNGHLADVGSEGCVLIKILKYECS